MYKYFARSINEFDDTVKSFFDLCFHRSNVLCDSVALYSLPHDKHALSSEKT